MFFYFLNSVPPNTIKYRCNIFPYLFHNISLVTSYFIQFPIEPMYLVISSRSFLFPLHRTTMLVHHRPWLRTQISLYDFGVEQRRRQDTPPRAPGTGRSEAEDVIEDSTSGCIVYAVVSEDATSGRDVS